MRWSLVASSLLCSLIVCESAATTLAQGTVAHSHLVAQQTDSSELENLEQALAAARESGDRTAELETLFDIARFYRDKEQNAEAIAYFQRVISLAQELDKLTFQQSSYQSLSLIYQDQTKALIAEQRYDEAKLPEQRSIETAQLAVELGKEELSAAHSRDRNSDNFAEDVARANNRLGSSYRILGGAYYNRGLRLANEGLFEEEIEVREQEIAAYQLSIPFTDAGGSFADNTARVDAFIAISTAYYWVGNAYRELGQYADAIVAAEQRLNYAQQSQSRNSEFNALGNLADSQDDLGDHYLDEGNYDRAIESYEVGLHYAQEQLNIVQSFIDSPELSIFESNDPERGQSIPQLEQRALQTFYILYSGLADVYEAQNRYDLALEVNQKNLENARRMDDSGIEFSVIAERWVIYSYLNRHQEAIEIAQQGVDLAQQENNPVVEISFLTAIASLQQDLGDYQEASTTYEEILPLAEEQGDIQKQVSILNNLGILYGVQGEADRTAETFDKVLEINSSARAQIQSADNLNNILKICGLGRLTRANERESLSSTLSGLDIQRNTDQLESFRQSCIVSTWSVEALVLSHIAVGYREQGRYSEAIEQFGESLYIDETYLDGTNLEDNSRKAYLLNSIGHVYYDQGRFSEAIDYYEQALDIAVANNLQSSIITYTANIGNVLSAQGDYSSALERHYSALSFDQDNGLRPSEIISLSNIGRNYYVQGRYSQADEVFRQALSLSIQLGHKPNQADIYIDLSLIEAAQGDYAQALEYAEQSLNIYEEIGALPKVATVLVAIGGIHATQGDYVAAIAAQQQALDITIEIGDLDDEAYARQQLALTYSQMGQYERALALNQQALEITQRIGNVRREASTLDAIGNIYSQQDPSQQALDSYAQALTIWQDIGDPVGESNSLRNAGFLKAQLGEYAAAEQAFQQALDIQQRIGALA